ncbi:MAG: InlB B-repeat-containing protein [Clostridia bacterium]|nr:InlB B-repeat-containing protein [Clostridia bacterium]
MKLKTLIAAVLAVVMTLAFVGCNQIGTSDNGGNTPNENQITVTWYDGSSELKSETLEKGSKATAWTPEKEGYTFMGWFAELSLAQAFDFEAELNEDTDIFASFRKDEFQEDTTNYYLIGTGAGDMKAANWDHVAAEANLSMTKNAEVTNANVYTIVIDMYAGDRFQICYGGGWAGQMGIGYMPGWEYAAGVNPNNDIEVTAEDKKYVEVKNEAGEVVFIGGDEYNNTPESWNAILADGQDGKYEITLTTYPAAMAYNTITWKLVEKLQAQEVTHAMIFTGTMTEWATDGVADEFKLKASEDKTFWTGTITITEDMYADWTETNAANKLGVKCAALKLFNTVSGTWFGDPNNEGQNFFLTAGTYAFKYVVETNAITYEALDYYIVGTFFDAEGAPVNYAVKEGTTPKMTVANGKATVTFTFVDVSNTTDYNWMAQQGKTDAEGNAAQCAIKVVYGSATSILNWYGQPDGDNFYVTAGTYTVTLDIATGEVTIVKA